MIASLTILLHPEAPNVNPGSTHPCWRNLPLIDDVIRGITTLITLSQLYVGEVI